MKGGAQAIEYILNEIVISQEEMFKAIEYLKSLYDLDDSLLQQARPGRGPRRDKSYDNEQPASYRIGDLATAFSPFDLDEFVQDIMEGLEMFPFKVKPLLLGSSHLAFSADKKPDNRDYSARRVMATWLNVMAQKNHWGYPLNVPKLQSWYSLETLRQAVELTRQGKRVAFLDFSDKSMLFRKNLVIIPG